MFERESVAAILHRHGFDDHKWLNPRQDIVVAHWVRFRCLFGCDSYGKLASCPPAVPSVDECRAMIHEYGDAVLLHLPMTSDAARDNRREALRLASLEREVFLAGNYKTFLLAFCSCPFCAVCESEGIRQKCRNKKMSRPSAEAMGIDVYQTARKAGLPIQVVQNIGDPMDRYAFLLVN